MVRASNIKNVNPAAVPKTDILDAKNQAPASDAVAALDYCMVNRLIS